MLKSKETLKNIKPYNTDLFCPDCLLKLDGNENNFGPSPKVLEAIKNVTAKDIQFYPFQGELIIKIAITQGVHTSEILLTNGADEAISTILNTYLEKDRSILTVTPTFVMPRLYTQAIGANWIEIPYENKWEFPIDSFLKSLDENISIVYLTTPNNPTGDIIPEEYILKIIEKAPNIPIVIDETYGNYSSTTNLDLVKKFENIFIVKSFSKDFALAGLRLGYIITREENINELKKTIPPYPVNCIAVKAGFAALNDIEYFENVKNEISKSKEILKNGLEKIGAEVYPSHANFICVNFNSKANFVHNRLLLDGIRTKNLSTSSDLLKNHLRITIPDCDSSKRILDLLNPKDTIVFDMDGVLIDTSGSYRLAIKKTYEYFAKYPLEEERIQELKNSGGFNNDWDLTSHLLLTSGVCIDYKTIVNRFQKYYFESDDALINYEKLLLDKDLLKKLSKKYNFSIFTGRPRSEALYTLIKYNIKDYFYPIITMDDLPLNQQKPHPLGLEKIKNSIITNNVYYLGDTIDDMKSGKAANVTPVGVLPPKDKTISLENKLIIAGAQHVVADVNEIFDLIERIK